MSIRQIALTCCVAQLLHDASRYPVAVGNGHLHFTLAPLLTIDDILLEVSKIGCKNTRYGSWRDYWLSAVSHSFRRIKSSPSLSVMKVIRVDGPAMDMPD